MAMGQNIEPKKKEEEEEEKKTSKNCRIHKYLGP